MLSKGGELTWKDAVGGVGVSYRQLVSGKSTVSHAKLIPSAQDRYLGFRILSRYTFIFCSSNFGKLNWFLGAGAKKDGRASKYPEIDFCKMVFYLLLLLSSIFVVILILISYFGVVRLRLTRQGPGNHLLKLTVQRIKVDRR